MNIFYLDPNPKFAAQMQCDKHVVKMILESAQLLSTAKNILDPENPGPYKTTHKNHPSAVWVRQSGWNYNWLFLHYVALCDEYYYRYGKIHKTASHLQQLSNHPKNIPDTSFINFGPPPQCMPDEYKIPGDTVLAYRKYYKYGKAHLLKYTKREMPYWATIAGV